MTKYLLKALAVLVFATTLAVVPTRAQQSDWMTMSVPFDFNVGDTLLSAGTYRVWQTSATTGAFLIQNVKGDESAAVISPARLQERDGARAKLVFHVYDGEYFLSQIWMPGSYNGAELKKSHHEEPLARAAANHRIVALVSNQR